MAAAEVRWKYDESCGTIEVLGHGELFPSDYGYEHEVFAGPIEHVGPASIASLRRALMRYIQCVPERQRQRWPLPPTWEIEVAVGDEEDPDYIDSSDWVFLEPTHLVFRHDGLRVAQDYAIKNNLVAEEVERCVAPYLRRHRCRDIEVAIGLEPDLDSDTRYCTVSFSPPTRGKTVHELYRLAQGLREFLIVLDYGGFTMQTLPTLLRAGRASMLIGQEENQWLEAKSAPYNLLVFRRS